MINLLVWRDESVQPLYASIRHRPLGKETEEAAALLYKISALHAQAAQCIFNAVFKYLHVKPTIDQAVPGWVVLTDTIISRLVYSSRVVVLPLVTIAKRHRY